MDRATTVRIRRTVGWTRRHTGETSHKQLIYSTLISWTHDIGPCFYSHQAGYDADLEPPVFTRRKAVFHFGPLKVVDLHSTLTLFVSEGKQGSSRSRSYDLHSQAKAPEICRLSPRPSEFCLFSVVYMWYVRVYDETDLY